MALKAGSVLQLPDLACIGLVEAVDPAYLSQKGVYHVLPIKIKGKFGARDGVFFFIFEPRWFGASFEATDLLNEGTSGRTKYGMYCRNVNGEGRNAILPSVLGEEFENFAAEFDGLEEPSGEEVGQIIRKYLVGRDVVYTMKQRTDEDGKLTEQYNIAGFFPYTDESLQYLVQQSQNENRKTPLVVTWDTE